jgi:hypothetical protein
LASMTCRRYSSAGISNGTPRTRLGGAGHCQLEVVRTFC